MRNKKRAALVGLPTGDSPSGLTSHHYKELTCVNGRDDGRRCGVLVIAVPFRFGVCGTSIAAGRARRQSFIQARS